MKYKKNYVSYVDPDNSKVNKENGEITELYIRKVCETQEEFLKVYLNSLDEMTKLDKRALQVLFVVLRRSRYSDERCKEGNLFYNDPIFKQDVKNTIGEDLSDNIINQYVSKLASCKLILRVKRGTFILNPRYFAKGTVTKETRINLIVTYDGF